MRKFDPWPVFFRREWSRNWPFLVGFAVTGAIITKLSLGPHRGGCEELPLCAEAQEVNLSMLHAERSSAICFLLLELNVESVGISMLPNND